MYLRFKGPIERVLGAIALILLSPLLIVISIVVRLTGPGVLFRQVRIGRGEKPFMILKFRTMVSDADDMLDEAGKPQGLRVTSVGTYLRRWGLDELPQLINVVRGEMALIGPRPVLPTHLANLTPDQRRRLEVRPGITGLAQVSGRNELRWSERIRLDVKYVESVSLKLDLSIAAQTFRTVRRGSGFVPDRNPHQVDDLGLN